jgi:hypothetical protein
MTIFVWIERIRRTFMLSSLYSFLLLAARLVYADIDAFAALLGGLAFPLFFGEISVIQHRTHPKPRLAYYNTPQVNVLSQLP